MKNSVSTFTDCINGPAYWFNFGVTFAWSDCVWTMKYSAVYLRRCACRNTQISTVYLECRYMWRHSPAESECFVFGDLSRSRDWSFLANFRGCECTAQQYQYHCWFQASTILEFLKSLCFNLCPEGVQDALEQRVLRTSRTVPQCNAARTFTARFRFSFDSVVAVLFLAADWFHKVVVFHSWKVYVNTGASSFHSNSLYSWYSW